MEDEYSICLSCVINNATENNFSVDINSIGNMTYVFTVNFDDTKTNSLHKFVFANKYKEFSCRNLPIEAEDYLLNNFIEDCAKQEIEKYNYSFYIEDVGALQAYVGVPFTAKLMARGFNLNYFDYTDLFDIDSKTGEINFIPSEDQEGKHEVLINVRDQLGNEELKIINITISKLQNESIE